MKRWVDKGMMGTDQFLVKIMHSDHTRAQYTFDIHLSYCTISKTIQLPIDYFTDKFIFCKVSKKTLLDYNLYG